MGFGGEGFYVILDGVAAGVGCLGGFGDGYAAALAGEVEDAGR